MGGEVGIKQRCDDFPRTQLNRQTEMAEPATTDTKEQVVTPWTAHAAEGANTIDYDKLIGNVICNRTSVSYFSYSAVW